MAIGFRLGGPPHPPVIVEKEDRRTLRRPEIILILPYTHYYEVGVHLSYRRQKGLKRHSNAFWDAKKT